MPRSEFLRGIHRDEGFRHLRGYASAIFDELIRMDASQKKEDRDEVADGCPLEMAALHYGKRCRVCDVGCDHDATFCHDCRSSLLRFAKHRDLDAGKEETTTLWLAWVLAKRPRRVLSSTRRMQFRSCFLYSELERRDHLSERRQLRIWRSRQRRLRRIVRTHNPDERDKAALLGIVNYNAYWGPSSDPISYLGYLPYRKEHRFMLHLNRLIEAGMVKQTDGGLLLVRNRKRKRPKRQAA